MGLTAAIHLCIWRKVYSRAPKARGAWPHHTTLQDCLCVLWACLVVESDTISRREHCSLPLRCT
jgi:hypothetical protein